MSTSEYELLSTLSAQMRQAAERGEWDQFISIEQEFNACVARIKPYDKHIDEVERQRSIELIQKILADNIDIRLHTGTRIAQPSGTKTKSRLLWS